MLGRLLLTDIFRVELLIYGWKKGEKNQILRTLSSTWEITPWNEERVKGNEQIKGEMVLWQGQCLQSIFWCSCHIQVTKFLISHHQTLGTLHNNLIGTLYMFVKRTRRQRCVRLNPLRNTCFLRILAERIICKENDYNTWVESWILYRIKIKFHSGNVFQFPQENSSSYKVFNFLSGSFIWWKTFKNLYLWPQQSKKPKPAGTEHLRKNKMKFLF